ncbi:MAG TPA: hypothetical protein VKB53_12855, partial [Gammaproteobacteria bacterium]|nr:hypothetical protein [Gammaproteobacteria bacterium]
MSPDSKEELISIKYVAILRHSCGYVRVDTYCSAILAEIHALAYQVLRGVFADRYYRISLPTNSGLPVGR